MIVDIVCAALVLLLALFGYFSGFLRQLGKLLALVLGLVAAFTLAEPVGDMVATSFDLSLFITRSLAFLLIFFVVTMILRILWNAVTRNRGSSESPSRLADRLLGALFGALKGVLLVYVALSLLIYAGPHLGRHGAALAREMKKSSVARAIGDDNILVKELIPYLEGSVRLANLLGRPERLQKQLRERIDDPNVQFLATHPKTQFLADPAVQAALREQPMETIVSDPRFAEMLTDPDVIKAFNSLELSSASAPEPASPAPATP